MKEPDDDKKKIKKALLDWFLKWEEVDTGVDNLKLQVNLHRKTKLNFPAMPGQLILGNVNSA